MADSYPRRIPTVAVIGHKNSGKTTLIARLIEAFTQTGMRVASIKHTSDEVGFDKPRSDSDRHKRAGAIAVGLVAKSEIGLYLDHAPQTSTGWIEHVLAQLPMPPELILYEGDRGGSHPKIECIRNRDIASPSFSSSEGLIAVVSDHPIATDVPVLSPEAVEAICAVIRSSLRRRDWPETRGKLH